MNKKIVHEKIIIELHKIHQNILQAVKQAHETATNKESVAENKYDTFGLEASYLAHGQAKRLAECESDLHAYNEMPVVAFNDDSEIKLGALIHAKDDHEVESYLFLGPSAGGVKVLIGDKEISLITRSSPLGKSLLGCQVGDSASIQLAGEEKSYQVIGIS